ncbi:hypothetical protein Z043_118215 [Scleropages formosus]|uniref:G protein-activated inward rectifier potassium channel 1 n=1 Tax=Scleropages formosus TaxID=113540 RepID=A0A0P7UUV4_SCLFO|nr:hypothetical protein Z043_118215 [Scleropages formosus]
MTNVNRCRRGSVERGARAHISLLCTLVQSRQTPEGEFLPLDQLELDVGFRTGADQLFLVSPLTICHVIDSRSPFYELSQRSMQTEQFEIVVILEGIVETTGERAHPAAGAEWTGSLFPIMSSLCLLGFILSRRKPSRSTGPRGNRDDTLSISNAERRPHLKQSSVQSSLHCQCPSAFPCLFTRHGLVVAVALDFGLPLWGLRLNRTLRNPAAKL